MNFESLVRQIRADMSPDKKVPGFDPANGNEEAKFLFLLEAPGPKAKDGIVSLNNPDPTANGLRKQLKCAGIGSEDIALWNVVPWYIGNNKNNEKTVIRSATAEDIVAGIQYLPPLLAAMPNLRCIVLVGGAARRAHLFLSSRTTARIVTCHHTSARVQNTNKDADEENIAIFRHIKATG